MAKKQVKWKELNCMSLVFLAMSLVFLAMSLVFYFLSSQYLFPLFSPVECMLFI